MSFFNLLKKFNERFSIKVFTIFILFIIIISTTFTFFSIHHQYKSFKNKLIKDGRIFSQLLAYNSRLGVFSENANFLKDPIDGILQQGEVLDVSIFNLSGRLLASQTRKGIAFPTGANKENPKEIFNRIRESVETIHIEGNGIFEFWSPVISSSSNSSAESLFFEEGFPRKRDRIIGFVSICVDKNVLNEGLHSLLIKNILIGLIFLFFGSIAAYFITKGITSPLKHLTMAVKSFRPEGTMQELNIETKDEIGKLAIAFNDMWKSLKNREIEKEQLEEQLRHAQKMEGIGTLAGGIAHDFNNILNLIIMCANLLKTDMGENQKAQIHLHRILKSSKRATKLVRSILAFSRKQIIDLKPINPNDVIKDLEGMLTRIVGEEIEFKFFLAQERLMIMADAGQIEQVLCNLITNAKDAMPKTGSITITTKTLFCDKMFIKDHQGIGKNGKYVLIEVRDTGTGMDKETLERIFDPFFTTKEVGKGTGLGLSMAYGIIRQHNGYIEVESELGKGTSFRIYLPSVEQVIEERVSTHLPFIMGGTEGVLLAEDDEEIRTVSKDTLEQYGYHVIDAIDGEEAIQKFMENNEKIHFLLFDVVMPKKNGKEAYEEIKKIRPDIKGLFISGYDQNVIQEKGILKEGIQLIHKPVSPSLLLRRIREVLDQKETKQI
ncbi:MAG: ATP-binding protein [bacterium]